ncbi:MAG: hypothetical protein MZW92_43410 [Comamonadaceae bacterium]|nr:hypothetical protein [Comamonadaceae bacterium]
MLVPTGRSREAGGAGGGGGPARRADRRVRAAPTARAAAAPGARRQPRQRRRGRGAGRTGRRRTRGARPDCRARRRSEAVLPMNAHRTPEPARRSGVSGRIARLPPTSQITPLLALVGAAARPVRRAGHAEGGRAADQRDDGQRADPVPGRRPRGRAEPGDRAGRAGARADHRHRARVLGDAAGPGGADRAVQGRRGRASTRWCGCTTR